MKDIGFVYEWLDLSNGKKYIGSHKGTPDDGYIGSGIAFNRAYEKRPDKFIRSIIYTGYDYKNQEDKLLSLVDAMNNDRYYNLTNSVSGGWDNISPEDRKIYASMGAKARIKSLKENGKWDEYLKKCKERGLMSKKNKTGIFGLSDEEKIKNSILGGKKQGPIQGRKNVESGVWRRACVASGKKHGLLSKKNKTGIFGLSDEEKIKNAILGGKAAGKKAREEGLGFFGASKEEKKKWQSKATEAAKEVNSKPILVYKKITGEFIGEYPSASEASRKLNLLNQCIYACLSPHCKQKSSGGYTFKYKNPKT